MLSDSCRIFFLRQVAQVARVVIAVVGEGEEEEGLTMVVIGVVQLCCACLVSHRPLRARGAILNLAHVALPFLRRQVPPGKTTGRLDQVVDAPCP